MYSCHIPLQDNNAYQEDVAHLYLLAFAAPAQLINMPMHG